MLETTIYNKFICIPKSNDFKKMLNGISFIRFLFKNISKKKLGGNAIFVYWKFCITLIYDNLIRED